MIIGIGTDIIEINRIEKAIGKRNGFVAKVFTDNEIEMFKERNMRAEVIAGNFAAKEAISKSFGTGIRGFSLDRLIGKSYKLNLSISHNNTSAIAFAILEES